SRSLPSTPRFSIIASTTSTPPPAGDGQALRDSDGSYRQLSSQPFRSANERIVALEEAQLTVDFARDADAHAAADRTERVGGDAQPERAGGTKVQPVQPPVDVHRGGQPARPPGQVDLAIGATQPTHGFDPLQGLECPEQDAGADARTLPANVERVPTAVDEVDVGVAALQEERAVARRLPPICMSRSIA